MTIITRALMGWPRTTAELAPTNKGLVIHYDGNNRGLAKETCEACKGYWEWCRTFHMEDNGWQDVGYCYFVCPHGNQYNGREYGREQAAQPSGNRTWCSVTTALGPNETPTALQIDGIRRLRQSLMAFGMKGETKVHKDFYNTDCPGLILSDMTRAGQFKLPPNSIIEDEEMILPLLKLGDTSKAVISLRCLVYGKSMVGLATNDVLSVWLNDPKFDLPLRERIVRIQNLGFPTNPEEWDGIVGNKTWRILLPDKK